MDCTKSVPHFPPLLKYCTVFLSQGSIRKSLTWLQTLPLISLYPALNHKPHGDLQTVTPAEKDVVLEKSKDVPGPTLLCQKARGLLLSTRHSSGNASGVVFLTLVLFPQATDSNGEIIPQLNTSCTRFPLPLACSAKQQLEDEGLSMGSQGLHPSSFTLLRR